MHVRRPFAAMLTVTVLAGCAPAAGDPGTGEPATPTEPGCGPAVNARVLTGGALYDFEPMSLAELAETQSLVLSGTVQSFAKGRDVLSSGMDLGYPDTRDRFAVLAVEVDTVYKGDEYVFDGHVYVNLFRGVEEITEDREPDREPGTPSTITSIADLAAATPAGVRVAVLGQPADLRPYRGEEWIGTHRGYPEGATLIAPRVQGLILEDGATCGVVAPHYGWDRKFASFDELERRLTELVPENR